MYVYQSFIIILFINCVLDISALDGDYQNGPVVKTEIPGPKTKVKKNYLYDVPLSNEG